MPRHQTLHKGMKTPITKLRKHPHVKRVTIGPYENCRHKYSPGTLVVKSPTPSGFKLQGYDGSGVYTFYVYLQESGNAEARSEIKAFVANKFS